MFLTTFGLLNIIVGVIVENTLAAARNNEDKLQALWEEQQKVKLLALKEIFEEADEDASGRVTLEEFVQVMQTSEAARDKIAILQLPTNDWEELFHILDDDGSGDLDIEELIVNSLRLRDLQKGSSLSQLVLATHSISRRLDRIMKWNAKTVSNQLMGDIKIMKWKNKALGSPSPKGPRSPRRLQKPANNDDDAAVNDANNAGDNGTQQQKQKA